MFKMKSPWPLVISNLGTSVEGSKNGPPPLWLKIQIMKIAWIRWTDPAFSLNWIDLQPRRIIVIFHQFHLYHQPLKPIHLHFYSQPYCWYLFLTLETRTISWFTKNPKWLHPRMMWLSCWEHRNISCEFSISVVKKSVKRPTAKSPKHFR